MKKSQIKVFEELLKDSNFAGKKQLKHLLWLNTSKPKFEVGEFLKATDAGHTIYGYPVKDFNAKIVRVYSYQNDDQWYYELEMVVECNGKKTTSHAFKPESALDRRKKCKDNVNVLEKAKSDCEDGLIIRI